MVGEWSYPVQVPIESANRRLGLVIPKAGESKVCRLTTQIVNGVTYLTLASTEMPCLIIHNGCQFPLVYGQTLTQDSEDVLEAMSLLAQPPVVQPGCMASYTFPTVNRLFPAHVQLKDYPRLKVAGEFFFCGKIYSGQFNTRLVLFESTHADSCTY